MIKAMTQDGRNWDYLIQSAATYKKSYFHGYGNSPIQGTSLCGLDANMPKYKCVLAPTIVDGGKLKRFGA